MGRKRGDHPGFTMGVSMEQQQQQRHRGGGQISVQAASSGGGAGRIFWPTKSKKGT